VEEKISRIFREIALICLGFNLYLVSFFILSLLLPEKIEFFHPSNIAHLVMFGVIDFGIFYSYFLGRYSYFSQLVGTEKEAKNKFKKLWGKYNTLPILFFLYLMLEMMIMVFPSIINDPYNQEYKMVFFLLELVIIVLSFLPTIAYGILYRRKKSLYKEMNNT